MATITLTVVAGATHTNFKTVSAGDMTRLANALRSYFNAPAATDAQIMTIWANFIFDEARAFVRDAERKTAASAIVDIALT